MRNIPLGMQLFTPDIMEFITGRDVVCQLLLEECKLKSSSFTATISLKSKLFADLYFSTDEIIEILVTVGNHLKVNISFSILKQIDKYSTIEDLATYLWKHTCRVVKNN
ncbi:MAG: hypothetical protein HYR66_13805 [Sphingobacteriales bacterium]|nr:hypothetical protein [Sphingobacteriales bacterium]MBI3720473.1 hypothetical protein [Sphingobacteriales bacterium]